MVSNHDELMSNFFAQPDALAYGKVVACCSEFNKIYAKPCWPPLRAL